MYNLLNKIWQILLNRVNDIEKYIPLSNDNGQNYRKID